MGSLTLILILLSLEIDDMILVDSSVRIEYFKGNEKTLALNTLLDLNALCVNDLILAELLPAIDYRKESLLKQVIFQFINKTTYTILSV